MTCRDWEERIALYAGGGKDETEDVERHLAGCPGCREAAAEFARTMEVLRGAHQEPIPEAYYAAVRARVLGELRRERRPARLKPWVCGLAAAAVIVALLLFPKPVRTPAPVAQASRPVAALSGGIAAPPAKLAVARPRPRKGRRQPKRADPAPPLSWSSC